MKRMRIKALLSLLLMLMFLLISISGAMLLFGKTGLILGFRRGFLLHFHSHLALFMLPFICCHVALNWRVLRQELKRLFNHRPEQKHEDSQ